MNEYNSVYSFLPSLLLSSCHSIPIFFGNRFLCSESMPYSLSKNLGALAISSYSDQCWGTMSQDSQVKVNDKSAVPVGKKPYLLYLSQPAYIGSDLSTNKANGVLMTLLKPAYGYANT